MTTEKDDRQAVAIWLAVIFSGGMLLIVAGVLFLVATFKTAGVLLILAGLLSLLAAVLIARAYRRRP